MRVKPKILGLGQGICLVFIFISLAFAASYRNTVTLSVQGAARSIEVTNATNGSVLTTTDIVNFNTGTNFYKEGNVLTVYVTNNYSKEADIYVLTTLGKENNSTTSGSKKWLYSNCTLPDSSCEVDFKDFSSFKDDFQNATKKFITLPTRTTMPVIAIYVDDSEAATYNSTINFWAFAFSKEDDGKTHLIGMDSKTILLQPKLGKVEYK